VSLRGIYHNKSCSFLHLYANVQSVRLLISSPFECWYLPVPYGVHVGMRQLKSVPPADAAKLMKKGWVLIDCRPGDLYDEVRNAQATVLINPQK
jgi:hypothetical protein